MSREAVIAAFLASLRAELDALEQVNRDAVDEATGDQSKAENKYDTRGLEASYLAAGQSERLAALRRLHGWLASDPPEPDGVIGLGSLTTATLPSGAERTVFLVPAEGGRRVSVEGTEVLAITPHSPLGRSLLGV